MVCHPTYLDYCCCSIVAATFAVLITLPVMELRAFGFAVAMVYL
ncbi:MAG TPA: hypothetical protein VNU45_15480 [Rummeliibacillus sp.]|nr:hypothetical protein [Rummeliibacillus sp.]